MPIVLSGEPKSTQSLYKMTCRGSFATLYMTRDGKDIKEGYQYEAKSQFKKKPYKGDLEVWVTLYFGKKGKRDWDNFHKLSMDALTGIVWEDDSQVVEAHVSKRFDKKNPRIEVEIININ